MHKLFHDVCCHDKNFSDFADDVLGDDDVFILESIAEAKKNDEENLRVTLILSLKDNLLSISRIIKIIEVIEFILYFSKK